MIHNLKTWPEYFQAVVDGTKTFEVRKNDRHFNEGDGLLLKEWNPETNEYTPRMVYKVVAYILHGGQFGIESGYVVMGLSQINDHSLLK